MIGALLLGGLAAPGAVAAQVYAEELRVVGFWPDAALTFGGGIGVGDPLDTSVMARARVGGLYAYEPLILNLGVTGEVGALAELGVGLEAELNHFGGFFARGALSRVQGDDWMSQATLGFMVFGVEWHHRFDTRPDDALLFTVRLPVGIWWFLLQHESAQAGARPRAQ